MRKIVLNSLMLLLYTALAACSRPASLPDQAAGGGFAALPAIAGLDALRGASSAQAPIDVTLPLDESNTSVIGSNLGFAPPPGQIAYAVYRILPPVDTVISIAAGGDNGLYLLVADYGAGHWSEPAEFASNFAVDSLSTLSNPFSPGGYIYCAVVAPPGAQGQLTSLALNYNGPANVYYVATPASGGDDSNPGTSDQPWATPQHAASSVFPDSLVIVRAGTYSPFVIETSGSDGAPILFKAEPEVVIEATGVIYGINLTDSSWITIDGFKIQNSPGTGISGNGGGTKAQHNTIRDNVIQSCITNAIGISYTDYALIEGNICQGTGSGDALFVGFDSDHATIRHNTVFNCTISGIALYNGSVTGGDNSLDDELITANTCYADGWGLAAGISADGMNGSTISNNLLYNNGTGIALSTLNGFPCTDNKIANNTVVQGTSAGSTGACVWIQDLCTGNKVFNNILFGSASSTGSIDITTGSLTGFLSDNNIVSDAFVLDGAAKTLSQWQSATLRDTHSQVSLPPLTFVNPDTPDYHLLATASAVGAALIDYMPSDDLDGVARPQGGAPDCGCYEYVP